MTHLPYGFVMLDLQGFTLTEIEKEMLAHPNTGAVILFARNYDNPQQISDLVKEIRQARKGDILIAVDQEGGRVQRFQTEFTRLPPAAEYAKQPEIAEIAGWIMAGEVLSVGVDFSFAPVLDTDSGISEIIGNRAFSTDSNQVALLASAFYKGMKRAGMAATGKHFPNHGAVKLDSHLTLPIDSRLLDDIRTHDLIPFKSLITQGLEAIMPAHVLYENVDDKPAGFSTFWLKTILRQELNFNGVIFSDDLSMAGAAIVGDFVQRAELALNAGCDMVLVCNNSVAAQDVLLALPVEQNAERQRRLETMRGQFTHNYQQLRVNAEWQNATKKLNQFMEKLC